MPKHVVMTGATGFIGAAVAAELLNCGFRVTVLLRSESDRKRLASLRGYASLEYSSLDAESTVDALRKTEPEIFIHCGWRGVSGRDRNETFQITENLPHSLAAVELAARAGCRQWIGLGSQAEYGNQNRRIAENDPALPTTLYGKAKLATGIAAMALCEARSLSGVWLRVFSTYGPGDAPHWFIPYVIREFSESRAPRLTACEQKWDYLYIADAARAVAAACDGQLKGNFNLGFGSARPLKDYIEAIRQELGVTIEAEYGAIPYRADQIMHLEADVARLTAATGWRPTVDLRDGIRATVGIERARFAELSKGKTF